VPSLGKPPNDGGDVWAGGELGQEQLDLALGAMTGPPQQLVPVLGSEMRSELGDAAQMKPPIGEHGENHGMRARGAAGRDAQIGFGLREVQDLGAIDIHGGTGLRA
jgi:hypothetical protein